MSGERDRTLARIAAQQLRIESLEPRGVDRLDFHDLHVDSIRAALEEAFMAGINEAAARLVSGKR